MILTGPEISREQATGRIVISPFTPEQVNPNSYNFRLGRRLRVYVAAELDPRRPNEFTEIDIPDEGHVLEPGRLYLAHTEEVLGSEFYAPTFAARSSVARLGLFINLSACLGDIGFVGQWTLQLYAVHRVRVYPGMNIGQMMWWRPAGEIALYDGKYQSSAGPRSSDIHLDLDRQIARGRFPGLRTRVEAGTVGNKFARLAWASSRVPVPEAFAVPATELTAAVPADAMRRLQQVFEELRATIGSSFLESTAELADIAGGLRMPPAAREMLRTRLTDVFGPEPSARFAVRSSGLAEDSAQASYAGAHLTTLGVTGVDEVIEAVEAGWRSYYAAPAVSARVRAGDFDPQPRLAVVVQRMVDARLAGVAMTGLTGDPERVDVEYREGLGDVLVAGADAALRGNDLAAVPTAHRPVLARVHELVGALRAELGEDVDVEWAADDADVYVLQVRPVTATVSRRSSAGPAVEVVRLYTEDPPAGADLQEVSDVYAGYVAKRGPAYRLAAAQEVPTAPGWLFGFNAEGLAGEAGAMALKQALSVGSAAECVLDLGGNLRQIIVDKDEVAARLAEVAEPGHVRYAVVRDFLRGDLGFISRLSGDGMVVEYTPEGLLALNRGTAGAQRVVVRDLAVGLEVPGNVEAPAQAAGLVRHLPTIARMTSAMQEWTGPVTVEWVYALGQPYFVDFSALHGDVQLLAADDETISAGVAHGPVLRLDDAADDEWLRRLSIGPAVSIDRSRDVTDHEGLARILGRVAASPEPAIVYARRPYAVLAVLIGQVAGFVFEEASALCHLAILLREARVPAAVTTVPHAAAATAVVSNGSVTLRRVRGGNA
ncbi:dCTP deaminase domain-containing protein [Micromonospora humi]|uniref:Deoxycytidine triphosphate deaminase n=1 Tax=Micromonospora humi TaxID=745366 RepID=A0A1C5JP59_9ACTN|nr:PEP/pyruvate-binding domain-containing protein [Micromonospora humi]SCG72350.1 deoxycytidine triphosphate deaminase [Micromonospora humi]